MADYPRKVMIVPPVPAVFDENAALEPAVPVHEFDAFDEQGAPTLAGLIWTAKQLGTAVDGLVRLKLGQTEWEIAGALRNLAAILLRHGSLIARPLVPPDDFFMDLLRSLVSGVGALLASEGKNVPLAAEWRQLDSAYIAACEMLDALEAGRRLIGAGEPNWSRDSRFEPGTPGFRASTSSPIPTASSVVTKAAVEAALAGFVEEGLRQVLPIPLSAQVTGVDTHEDVMAITPVVKMRVLVKIS